MAYRLTLRRDAIGWLRERRAQLYVDLLTEAHAEQYYLSFVTSSDTAREQMREVFAATGHEAAAPGAGAARREGLGLRQPAGDRVI